MSLKWPYIVARPTRFSEHSAVSGMAGPPCLNAMLLKVYLNQKHIITLTSNAICTSNGFLCKLQLIAFKVLFCSWCKNTHREKDADKFGQINSFVDEI
jgi:hypothetical protein